MYRRAFISGVALTALVARPRAATAQPSARVRRVGWLMGPQQDERVRANLEIFSRTLAERGWIEGQNIAYEWPSPTERGRISQAVAELLHRKVDVIVTSLTTAIRVAKDATSAVPIVMAGAEDPVGAGLIQSLARPGGNITGVSLMGAELMEKHLELVKQVVPGVRSVTLIGAAGNPANRFFFEHMEAAGKKLGIRVVSVDIRGPDELEAAFGQIASDAAITLAALMFLLHRDRIADLAIKRRLPLVTWDRLYARAGFLLTYGPLFPAVLQAAAVYVDKILRGARPADLPVEQPSKFHLTVNLKTAKALGLTIPPAVILRADQVIE